MIGVIAKLKVRPEAAAAFEAVVRELAASVRAHEPGCRFYSLHRRSPEEYVMLEGYVDADAFDAHRKADYVAAARPKLAALLAAPGEFEVLEGVV